MRWYHNYRPFAF